MIIFLPAPVHKWKAIMMTGLYPGPETGEYFHAVSEYYHISTNVISILSAWQPPGLGEAIMTTGLDPGQGGGGGGYWRVRLDRPVQSSQSRPASSDAEKS